MFVTDLRHFLDLPEDTPGPACRLAEQLSNIVRAATAGDVGTVWTSALLGMRSDDDRIILSATDDDLEELIGSVAAEANHETNRRRRQRLDTAFDALTAASQTGDR